MYFENKSSLAPLILDVNGRPAMLMDNYPGAISVKAFGTLDDLNQALPYLGKNSLADLEKIKQVVSKYDIDDFQVMITPEGRVLIHDPLELKPRQGGGQSISDFVESLIVDAKSNAAKQDKGQKP